MYARFQITKDIEKIVNEVIITGERREMKDYRNGEVGDPAFWLTADWVRHTDDNEWYVEVQYRYCDTGNVIAHFAIYETVLSDKEYREYTQKIKEKGYAEISDVLKS